MISPLAASRYFARRRERLDQLEFRVRSLSRAEHLAAWLCGGGALLVFLGWNEPEPWLNWIGAGFIVVGCLLWIREGNRRRASKWVKENEDV